MKTTKAQRQKKGLPCGCESNTCGVVEHARERRLAEQQKKEEKCRCPKDLTSCSGVRLHYENCQQTQGEGKCDECLHGFHSSCQGEWACECDFYDLKQTQGEECAVHENCDMKRSINCEPDKPESMEEEIDNLIIASIGCYKKALKQGRPDMKEIEIQIISQIGGKFLALFSNKLKREREKMINRTYKSVLENCNDVKERVNLYEDLEKLRKIDTGWNDYLHRLNRKAGKIGGEDDN